MTKEREALKLALVALEKLARLGNGDTYGNSIGNVIAQAAIAAIQNALAQPSDSVKQEPVARYSDIVSNGGLDPRNTVPQKREWVRLTDKEIDAALKSCNTTDTYKYFRAIEAKLKEKNA